jgi:hypothetical protein
MVLHFTSLHFILHLQPFKSTISSEHPALDALFQMDDREFSSPVCYLDCDNYQVPATRDVEHTVCTTCRSFIAALDTNLKANEEGVYNGQAFWNGRLVAFILNETGCVYKNTDKVAEISGNGCPLCAIIEGLKPDERKELLARRECGEQNAECAVFEFKTVAKGEDFWVRLVPALSKN